MYTIEAHLACPDVHSEVLPADTHSIELQIENVVGLALLELFETVYVTNVEVKYVCQEHTDTIPT